MEFQISQSTAVAPDPSADRRRSDRLGFHRAADWDFFTDAQGAQTGFLIDVSSSGCLLASTEVIAHRRWIRLIVKAESENIYFTAVGRVVRREDRMEQWGDRLVTLHRFGVEFIHPLNDLVLRQLATEDRSCGACGARPAQRQGEDEGPERLCVLCHLRRACQNLLIS
jgi:hypothetical protein